ncbi:type II toxin-antitoxin system death-on-curing family toxin [Antribacter sp. KLBMP9083]|uniref:Type II toxin-antitoxin system death-on-curing family toxin n=1 Tax=Antribacter soli TaxID=2910976 RepID=A0AA41QAG5_9MICO|nr:type II toxin-antitoxin system death-on-curing family toxin [Antribacter soli]MCF4119527.1 type II toxin-antitoxin system death-on-curing family toxin [Antribacter soli]
MTTRYLTPAELLWIADQFLDRAVEVRDAGLLDSAVSRPAASMMGVEAYPTLDLKAAALLDSVVNNHALIDGNKRLGLIAVATFYELNDHYFDPPQAAVYDLVMAVADGSERDVAKIAAVLGTWRTPQETDDNRVI